MLVRPSSTINTDGINHFQRLPLDMKNEILLYFDIPTLNNVSNVCKDLSNIVNEKQFLEKHPKTKKVNDLGLKIFPPAEPQTKSNRFLSYFKKVEITKERTMIQNTLENFKKINNLKIKDTIIVWEKIYEQSTQIAGRSAISIPIFDEIKKSTNKKEGKKAFGDWIEQNKNNITLDNLVLENLGLYFLPKQLFNLTQLQRLYLAKNNLTSIPDEIRKLNQLLGLDLSYNKLTSIPDEIGKLNQLRGLDLRQNKLTSIPDEIEKLNQLLGLDLRQNKLTSIPDEIEKLIQLQELRLSNNNLTSIPNEIGKLTLLRGLYLAKNKLSSIPNEIGKLNQLQELDLRNNNLTSIPDEIEKLTQLQMLWLEQNNLSNYPACLDQLSNTKVFGKNILIAHEALKFLGGSLAHSICVEAYFRCFSY